MTECSREHQQHIPLELVDTGDVPIPDPRPYGLQVHRPLDDLMVIRRIALYTRRLD